MLYNNFPIGLQATLQPLNKAFSLKKTALGGLIMTSEAAGTRPIIFNIKSYPCIPKAGSHSIQGTAPASYIALFFFHEISFYASFEAYSYVFTAQTTDLWKTGCDLLAQTRERHRYTDHEY